jgi:hypothetical protein
VFTSFSQRLAGAGVAVGYRWSRMAVARNVAIILALAAAVHFLPGGGAGADAVSLLLSVILFGGLLWFGARLYLEHRLTIDGLGERNRVLLYGGLGLATLALVGTGRLWNTGAGVVLWLLLMGAAAYSLYTVYRASRSY